MNKKMMLTAGVMSMLTMAALPGYAETLTSFNLDEVVVTAGRADDDSINVKELIDAGQVKTAADILVNVPGIVVNKGQNNGVQIGLRGLNHERVVIAVNGNVVQNIGEIAQGRALEWDALPVTNVKKIELIRGAGTVAYGGAVAGVINIITDDNDAEGVKTTLRQSFGSWRTDKTTVINRGSTDNGKFSWTGMAARSKSNGYYRNNDSNGHDMSLSTTYKLNETDKLNLNYSHIYRKEGMIVGNNRNGSPASRYLGYDGAYPETPNAPMNRIDGYRQWKTDNISLNYENDKTDIGVYDYRQNRKDFANRVVRKKGKPTPLGMEKAWDADIRDYGVNWKQVSELDNHTLRYGLQYSAMKYDIHQDGRNCDMPEMGAFIEDDWSLDDRTTLSVGMRYDHDKFKSNLDVLRSKTHTQLSPKVKLSHSLDNDHTVFIGASRLFRAPLAADYARWGTGYIDADGDYRNMFAPPGATAADWQELLGVPEPEKGMSYELGWRGRLDDKNTVGVTGYYYDIDDFLNISFGYGPRHLLPPIVYNIDNVKVKGIEFISEHSLDRHWTLTTGYTHQRVDKSGDRFHSPLKALPKTTASLGAHYNSLHGLRVALYQRYMGKLPFMADSDYVSPYAVADLTASWSIGDHTVNLAVNNLFDRKYEHYSGYRQPGINYNVSYQFTF